MRNQMNKLFYIDVETTGTNSLEHEINQISILFEDVKKETTDAINLNIIPRKISNVDPKALQAQNKTLENLINDPTAIDSIVAYKEILAFFDKHVDKFNNQDKATMIGWNSNFDYKFVKSFFISHGNKYFGSYIIFPTLDVQALAKVFFPNLENYKLHTVAKHLHIDFMSDNKTFHDSLYDINVTKIIYKSFEQIIQLGIDNFELLEDAD